jgi:hypothetical protein
VTVRLVEAAPVAGALRFELLSDPRHGSVNHRRRRRPGISAKHAAATSHRPHRKSASR